MTQELIIYDSSYFKTVTKNALMDGTCIVLYETYYNMYKNPHNYQILQDELLELIQTKRLIIESVPSLYQQTTERDKIISLALLKSSDYEVTVYTKDEKLALDLLLNDIHVQNRDFAHLFTNIGKSEEKEDIFVYDTSTLLQYMNKIDFSKNFHYLFTCVLEELLFTKPHTDHSPLFKMLYILNTYPDHVKIIPTVSSTQQKGRYSSTDFLILCSTIYAKNQEKKQKITLLTSDHQLFYEAMYFNQFSVASSLPYFDDIPLTSINEEESISRETSEIETETIVDSPTNEISADETEKEPDTEVLDPILDSENTENLILTPVLQEDNLSDKEVLQKKIIQLTNHYTKLPLIHYQRKYVLDLPEIIEHVYNNHFFMPKPLDKKQVNRNFSNLSYRIKIGYYITFKDNPEIYYKVMEIKKCKAILERIS